MSHIATRFCLLGTVLFGFVQIACAGDNSQLDTGLGSNEATLSWHTFLGSSTLGNFGNGVAVDENGGVYVTGKSFATWGDPIEEFVEFSTAIAIAKLNSSGELLWNTFHGSASSNEGFGITVDDAGNVYVVGTSDTSWGTPLNPHSGANDMVILKLNPSGELQWHTFFGHGSKPDTGLKVVIDSKGDILVAASSSGTWGSNPISPYTSTGIPSNDTSDIVVLKLNSDGALLWHTFHGSTNTDNPSGIAVDASGNVYVAGSSRISWGDPVRAFAGGNNDGVVIKLSSSGELQWHSFLGSSSTDNAYSVAIDSSGNPYVTGRSNGDWPGVAPIKAHSEGLNSDYFLARLGKNGILDWYAFYGSTSSDNGMSVMFDCNGDLFIFGSASASWGTPVSDFPGGATSHNLLKLDGSGNLLWHTFFGSDGQDISKQGVSDRVGRVTVVGQGPDFGTPVNGHSGSNNDIMVAQFAEASFCFKIFKDGFE